MLSEEIRQEFNRLKVCGQRSALAEADKKPNDTALVAYLKNLLVGGTLTSPEDIGFCYWNLSDNYAFLRDTDSLYNNFLEFREFTASMAPQYYYWCICDGTQRARLESGGYGDIWWETYHAANELNPHITDINENIVFSTHRTSVTYPPLLGKTDKEQLDYAFDCFKQFLDSTNSSDQHDFHQLIYESALMQNFGSCTADLNALCTPFYSKLTSPKVESDALIGEWTYQNASRCPHDQAVVGILAAVNALIYAEYRKTAQLIYENALHSGLAVNRYVEKRLYNS